MWLPASVYERIPHFWMLIGVLFVAGAFYFGFNYTPSYTYMGLGLLCVIWSGFVIVLRTRRKQRAVDQLQSEDMTD